MRLRHAGFSLLELLVVVVIIGLAVAIVGLSLGDNKPQQLRNAARDFANAIAQVEDEAILGRESWGVQIYRVTNAEGEHIAYRFLRLSEQGWRPEAPNEIPRETHFTDNITARLEIDGAEQLIEPLPAEPPSEDEKNKTHDQNKAITPTIWLAPGGEVTPFVLQLRFAGDEHGPIVRSDALGRIELDIGQNDENN